MKSHTPGPWYIGYYKATESFRSITEHVSVHKKSGDLLAITGPSIDMDSVADARLIAASPEMLAALKEIAEGAGPYSRDPLEHASNTIEAMKEIASEAIAKAEGRD